MLKERKPDFTSQNHLEQIWDYQRFFMDLLIVQGKLKAINPLIDSREFQNTLRELAGFYVEELVESYQAYEKVVIAFYETPEEEEEPREVKILNLLEELNQELSDCVAFLTEILIFNKITPHDLSHWARKVAVDEKILDGYYIEGDILRTLFSITRYRNIKWGMISSGLTRVNFFENEDSLKTRAGRAIYPETEQVLGNMLFNCIASIYKAVNLLKEKPWREQSVEPDQGILQEALVKAYFDLIAMVDYLNWNPNAMLYNFYLKFVTNCERQEEGY